MPSTEGVPTLTELDAFLDMLRQQASFLADPAIYKSVEFIERCRPAIEAYFADRVGAVRG